VTPVDKFLASMEDGTTRDYKVSREKELRKEGGRGREKHLSGCEPEAPVLIILVQTFFFFFAGQEISLWDLHMIGKGSTAELHPQTSKPQFFQY
jgi:hypothetical protein